MKLILIGNAGGHFEQLKQIKQLSEQFQTYFVTNKTSANQNSTFIQYFIKAPHGKNKLESCIGYLINMFEAIHILQRTKPDIIISTGAGIAVPMMIIGKLLGIKIIFIESFARIDTPSKTGKIAYRLANYFIVQHEKLMKYYPNAVYGGWIY